MNQHTWRVLTRSTTAAALALTVTIGTTQAFGVDSDDGSRTPKKEQSSIKGKERIDDFPHPLGNKQRELREKAVRKLIKGDAKVVTKNGSRSIKVGDEYAAYDIDRTANVFTVLSEFGDKQKAGLGDGTGPLHNQIAKPDRKYNGNATDDNSTYWLENFDQDHFKDLMFGEKESFKHFYKLQSNGRFDVRGDVSDWVTVPYGESRYGSNSNPEGEGEGYWNYVKDTINAWYADQKAQGKSKTQIKKYLAQFDVWDRYDYDNDGDFDESDGYIDHFQAIHAGEGEEAGGGAQGEDAIWSHRWYAFGTDQGKSGPSQNLAGGAQVGDTGLWVGDYTTEPENGGLGVFTHEFGHDLGLPDLYDTAGGDNGTAFWTLMSSGSWLNRGGEDIGTTPGYMGAWEKLQLGWLDFTTVEHGKNTKLTIDQAALASPKAKKQAVVVNVPDKSITEELTKPKTGTYEWWSGKGNGINNTMTRSFDLTDKTTAKLDASVFVDTEKDYDFVYSEVSTDGGKTFTQLGEPLSGSSAVWTPLSFDLTPYAGKKIDFRFRYQTDTAVAETGAFFDDISVTADGTEIFADGAENGENGWVADGFKISNGTDARTVGRYYLAENRTYTGYDKTLKTGPYNFGWGETKPDWVERFPYQDGLLIWYANGEFEDNNTSVHAGEGQALPIDARPTPITVSDGYQLRNRQQVFDATFGIKPTDEVVFHHNGTPKLVGERPGVATFNDADPNRYFSEKNPGGTTKTAGSGTKITVLRSMKGGKQLQLRISFKR